MVTNSTPGAVQGQSEAAQREIGFLALFSNSCQHCTLLKPIRSLKPARSGNPQRASQTKRCDSKNADFSLLSPRSPNKCLHLPLKAPHSRRLFEGNFRFLLQLWNCETVNLTL